MSLVTGISLIYGSCLVVVMIIFTMANRKVSRIYHESIEDLRAYYKVDELNELYLWACIIESRHPDKTYEQGIQDVITWIQNNSKRPDLKDQRAILKLVAVLKD